MSRLRTSRPLLLSPTLGACTAPLLPAGEQVLSASPAFASRTAAPGAALGAALSVEHDRVLVGAPGAGQVLLLDDQARLLETFSGEIGLGRQVWLQDGRPYAALPGRGVQALDSGEWVLEAPEARGIDLCADDSGGRWVSHQGGPIACGPEQRLLWLDCAGGGGDCAVSLDGAEVDRVGPDSAVAFMDGVACWGDADIAADPLPGQLMCEDGLRLPGEEGDHLGVSLGGGYGAGVFNRWRVPMRARAIPLRGGPTWIEDNAAERSPLALADGAEILAIGVPGYLLPGGPAGRVYIARIDAVDDALSEDGR